MSYSALLSQAEKTVLDGTVLDRKAIISLLSIPLGSEDDKRLREIAKRVAFAKTDRKAYIWSAIGADYVSCSMNCRFCSFGEAWDAMGETRKITPDALIKQAKTFLSKGAHFVVFRTTEFYNQKSLCALAKWLHAEVAGDYKVVLNTGEIDDESAALMRESGIAGIYHACRLGEGSDTPFDPSVRLQTMRTVSKSGLQLISNVEPIGPEHENADIADNFLAIIDCGASISGCMARIPVKGTPLGKTEQVSDSRIAQIIAVLRLSGGNAIRDICVHPATSEALESGANVVVVERGAIPRDRGFSENAWRSFDTGTARRLIEQAGFTPTS